MMKYKFLVKRRKLNEILRIFSMSYKLSFFLCLNKNCFLYIIHIFFLYQTREKKNCAKADMYNSFGDMNLRYLCFGKKEIKIYLESYFHEIQHH